MRIMAIDFGDAHTGVALSDPTGFIASQSMTVNSHDMRYTAQQAAARTALEKLQNRDNTEAKGH